MSHLIRATYASMATSSIIFLVYAFVVFQVIGVDYFTGPDALVRIGKSLGILIIAGYTFEWSVQITTLIFGVKGTGKPFKDLIVDEREKQIVYRSMSISLNVICFGIILSVGALALGWEAFWVFHIIVLFYALAVATELVSKIVLFRRGF